MESKHNYLNYSTGLTTPTDEFEDRAQVNAIDLITDTH